MFDFKLRHEESIDEVQRDVIYDVAILGGGPGGLAAALYASRAGLNAIVLEKAVLGGQITLTALVENCPGCTEGSGAELIAYMERQAVKFGAKIAYADIREVDFRGMTKSIYTTDGVFRSKTVIIATGASSQKLGVPGEQRLRGRGVSYCSTCDGPFYKDKVVAVIGGGDAAIEEAGYLTRFASRVIVIHRRDALRATKIIQERALANPKIEFRWDTAIEEIQGEDRVRGLVLKNLKTGQIGELAVDGVFVYIGMVPNTRLFQDQIELTPRGYVVATERMETSTPGVFVAGDVRETPLRQLITAAADGSIAATYADRYISGE